ncbi:MAG: ATP-binding protein [Anaerolineales bacterium]
MPKKPSERLHEQLDKLFTGLPDPAQAGRASVADLRGPVGWIWESDAAGRYTWCSPEVERILGRPPEELIGQDVAAVGLSTPSSDLLRNALAGPHPVRNLKLQARAHDGSHLTLLVNTVRRTSPNGDPAGHRGAVQVVSVKAPAEDAPASVPDRPPTPPADLIPTPLAAPAPTQVAPPVQAPARPSSPPADRSPAPPGLPVPRELEAPAAKAASKPTPAKDLEKVRTGSGRPHAPVVEVPASPSAPRPAGEFEEEARLARLTAHEVERVTEGPTARILRVPVRTQDGLYATLEFEAEPGQGGWADHDRLLVEAVAQQLGTAIQDARTHALTQTALEEMREADRLKTQFLANMSHELRTPLNSIIGFSRVILKGIDGPITDLQEQDLSAIYNAGLHLLGLINDILDLTKIEARKMELTLGEVDLREVIRSVMATAVGLVKDRPIELAVQVPEDLPRLQADALRVRQILLNLISNAAKFTERGRIGVSARVVHSPANPEIEVSVSDTGLGIDRRAQAKLFEPFTQVDASTARKTSGTGLGLSICRHLVELHGGRIWVDSTPGQGSTFFFTLPLQPPDSLSSESISAPAP